ncbi:MAG: hypothetical protein LBD50_02945 [Rickettsiales bacterium]|jgi:glutaredoxin|nr:hypothetical protein [Rickettsiales bacterium]
MKKIIFCGLCFAMAIFAARAADLTLYYSPTCPHCHNARAFIAGELVYEYPSITAEAVNVMEEKNLPAFQNVLMKCKYESGGVPVIVIGEKCFQGYADFMKDELRGAAEAGLSDKQKAAAADVRKSMESDAQKYKSEHKDRENALVERAADAPKKNSADKSLYFYGLLIVLVLALGAILLRKKNKN